MTRTTTLTARTAISGDYNLNGKLDAADYVVWRKNLGSPSSLRNDNTPGVGPDDYTRWRSNFGSPAGSGSAATVPRCACTMDRTMARPRPLDPALAGRFGSSRWNGSNSRSTSAGGITSPLLCTMTTAAADP